MAPHLLVKDELKFLLNIFCQLLSHLEPEKKDARWFYQKGKQRNNIIVGHFSTTQDFILKKLDKFLQISIRFHPGHQKLKTYPYSWGMQSNLFDTDRHQRDRTKCPLYRGVRIIKVGNVWFLAFLGPNELYVIERCLQGEVRLLMVLRWKRLPNWKCLRTRFC